MSVFHVADIDQVAVGRHFIWAACQLATARRHVESVVLRVQTKEMLSQAHM